MTPISAMTLSDTMRNVFVAAALLASAACGTITPLSSAFGLEDVPTELDGSIDHFVEVREERQVYSLISNEVGLTGESDFGFMVEVMELDEATLEVSVGVLAVNLSRDTVSIISDYWIDYEEVLEPTIRLATSRRWTEHLSHTAGALSKQIRGVAEAAFPQSDGDENQVFSQSAVFFSTWSKGVIVSKWCAGGLDLRFGLADDFTGSLAEKALALEHAHRILWALCVRADER